MTRTPILTILGGGITQTFLGETETKGTTTMVKGETIIKNHTLTKGSKVRGSGNNNPLKSKGVGVVEERRVWRKEEFGGAARGIYDSHRECLQEPRSSTQGPAGCYKESGKSIWPNGQAHV